jgi:uncharacterized protein (TIGR00297 family)
MNNPMQMLLGLVFAIGVSWMAHRMRSLSQSGLLAAAGVGTIIFGLGGWEWAVILLTFFVTSSLLSRLFGKYKVGLDDKFSKGHERDAGQVCANGCVATLFAVGHVFFPDAVWTWIGFAASLAAVNADTWATELGVLNPSAPRLITHLHKRVEKGTSGGVSVVGTLASLLGAALISSVSTLVFFYEGAGIREWIAITAAGLIGSFFDSFLGATIQAIYFCRECGRETESHPLHKCGNPTRQLRGLLWVNNDLVNFSCSVLASIVAIIMLG